MGYEFGGGVSASTSRRRWLAVLVAFVIGAALLLALPGPAEASGGGYTPPSISASPDGCSVDVTVTPGSQTVYVIIVPIYRTGSHWPDDYQFGNGMPAPQTFTFDGLQPGSYKAKAVVTRYPFLLETDFTISPNDCHPSFANGNFSGTVECTAACTVAVKPIEGEEKAHIEVNSNEFFKINLLLTDWKPPGQTFVKVEGSDGKDGFLPKCGNNGKSGTNCYHVNTIKVQGKKALDFDVFWDDGDPRFKFG